MDCAGLIVVEFALALAKKSVDLAGDRPPPIEQLESGRLFQHESDQEHVISPFDWHCKYVHKKAGLVRKVHMKNRT